MGKAMAARLGWGWVMVGAGLIGVPNQARAADILFQAEAQSLAGTCAGRADVRLEGNHNIVVLTGTCGSLLVKGLANTIQVTIADGGTIHVEGAQNHISYASTGAAPAIEILGPDNEVSPGGVARPISAVPAVPRPAPTPAAPPAPKPLPAAAKATGPLELSGDDQDRLEDCAGRDLVVTGMRSSYVVHGACHSVQVSGDLLTVQAVIQSGARISVAGQGSIVSWFVPGKGRPPAAIVRGAGSRVQRAEAIGGAPVR